MNAKSKIEVVSYDPRWSEIFETEKSVILKALGNNFEAIYHIGSTAVPGLAAKPKIDIIAVAKNRKKAIADLKKAGYSYDGEWNIPLKCGFTKRDDRKINLHVFFDKDHPEIELNLLFRDYLKSNPDAREEYTAIKTKILQDETSQQKLGKILIPVYTIKKRKFIDDILGKIGFNRLRVLKCLTDDEWDTAKNLRQKYFFDNQKKQDPYFWTFNHKDHEHFVLYLGIKIIGYAHIQLLHESRSALGIIAIAAESRNHDFGSQFLSIIEEWLKIHDCKTIHVLSDEKSLNFYKKHGYTEISLSAYRQIHKIYQFSQLLPGGNVR